MGRAFFSLGVAVFLILAVGIIVSAQGIPETAQNYISEFAQKRGIDSVDMENVRQVDFNDLPGSVNIGNVGDHNLAIYEVPYEEEGSSENIYVITYSTEKLDTKGDLIVSQDKRSFLNFGFSGEMSESGFLETATGVGTSFDKGYVMMRDGSITAISTNLEVLEESVAGTIEIVIYINGEEVNFGNRLSTESTGDKRDYDVMSKGVAEFSAGDVVSVGLNSTGEAMWKDVTTLVEITTTS